MTRAAVAERRTDDDAALARRAARGDAEAEGELCRAFAPRIWAWGMRHLGDRQEAWDLVQEVLVVTIEALRERRLERPEQIGSFVLGTCRLVTSDRRRTDERRRALRERFPLDLAEGRALAPGSATADFRRMFDCLRALPYAARRILVMTFFEEAPADRIAAEAGTSVGNVRVIRHRALAQLRACLEDCAAGAGEGDK